MDMNNETCYTSSRKRSYEELTLADDFMFCKIMQKERFCKELLEIILGVEIERIVYHEDQKVFQETIDGKGIRLDVYVKDENHTIYDLEMQTTNTRELPKRTRYYHSSIDRGHLVSGEKYNKLNDTYVIFICTFDLFGEGYGKYTFHTMCEENKNIKLPDGRHTIFVNTSGIADNKKLQDFLNYIEDGTVGNSTFIRELDEEVRKNSFNISWKEEYNMLLAREELLLEEGARKGRKEGKLEGIQEGLQKGLEMQYRFMLKMIKDHSLSYESCLENVEDKADFEAWYQKHK